MEQLKFKDMTITYNKEDMNEKAYKKRNIITCVISSLSVPFIFGIPVVLSILTQSLGNIISFIIGAISMIGIFALVIYVLLKILYGNKAKSYMFLNWARELKEVEARYYGDEVILRVTDIRKKDMYNIDYFLNILKTNKDIKNEAEKGKEVHIEIDVRDNNNTYVVIKNKEGEN